MLQPWILAFSHWKVGQNWHTGCKGSSAQCVLVLLSKVCRQQGRDTRLAAPSAMVWEGLPEQCASNTSSILQNRQIHSSPRLIKYLCNNKIALVPCCTTIPIFIEKFKEEQEGRVYALDASETGRHSGCSFWRFLSCAHLNKLWRGRI